MATPTTTGLSREGNDRPVLVTGAAGFIGSHVTEALLARGQRVVGLDNFDPFYPRALKVANLAEVRGHAHAAAFEFIEGDLVDAAFLRGLLARVRPEGIIHLAAKAGVRPSLEDPAGYARANVLGTSVVLDEARRAGCQRVVVASSSSVYGNCPVAPFREDLDVSEPISPYAATKRACELLGFTHWHTTKMPTAMLRFFTVYGPRQRPDLAISLFLNKIARGEDVPMFGDPRSSRDYTFISDIVAGVLAAYDRIDAHGYRVWNLGSNRPVALGDLIAAVGEAVGRTPKVLAQPARTGDVERTWADLTRSGAELGYEPRTSLREGLARQWVWAQSAAR